MQRTATRPVYLNLLAIRQPIGAIISILHRITGAVLSLLTPFAVWALQVSLETPAGFAQVKALLNSGFGRAAWLLALWALVQHLYSGIRHLLIDIDMGVELRPARRTAWLTLIASIITVAIVGVSL